MLNALQWILAPPAIVVLVGVLAAVGTSARLFGRPRSMSRGAEPLASRSRMRAEIHPDPFDQDLLWLPDHWTRD